MLSYATTANDLISKTGFHVSMGLLAEHYSDDLGMELEDSLEQDFNMKLEDGSPYEVAKMLVLLHNELLQRNEDTLNKLRQTDPVPVAASRSERVSVYCRRVTNMAIELLRP